MWSNMAAEALAIAFVFYALVRRREVRQWSQLPLRSLPECPTQHFHLYYIGQNSVLSLVFSAKEVQKCSHLVKHIDTRDKFGVLLLKKEKTSILGQ